MQLEMLSSYRVELASECENEQGLELFGGRCLVECCAVPRTDLGFSRREERAELWPALAGGCAAGEAMGVIPLALLLSVEPLTVTGSPPFFLKKAVAKQHEFKGSSKWWISFFVLLLYSLYILFTLYYNIHITLS